MNFQRDGYMLIDQVLTPGACDGLLQALDEVPLAGAGSRTLLNIPAIADAALAISRHPRVASVLDPASLPVQCTLFAKDQERRWSVPAHQDLSIPVLERRDLAGWSGWSRKEGNWYVQPPVAVLEQLVAVRLQLDHDAEHTGPLEIAAGTHAAGRLSAELIRQHGGHRINCAVARGGAVVMRPLLIHASGKPRTNGQRRVLHYLYGPPLPDGMQWTPAF